MAEDFREFVERVKRANNIEDVIEETGGAEFKLRRVRGNYLTGETHDSFKVKVDEQYYFWNQRAGEGEKGDVFTWLERHKQMDFWGAVEYLSARAKIEIPAHFRSGKDEATRLAARVQENIWGVAQRVFAKWLWGDPEALDYARGRGWSDETIQEAGVGFSGRGSAAAFQDMRGEFAMHTIDLEEPVSVVILGFKGDVASWGRKYNVEVQDSWVQSGYITGMMSRTRLVYSHFEGGKVRYMSGRNILGAEIWREEDKERTVKSWNPPKVLAGPRQPYYNHVYGRKADLCVVVEGQGDATALGELGIPAMATGGTSWQDMERPIGELRKRHKDLYIGLDNDEAGIKTLMGSREEPWPLARLFGPMGRVIRWPGGNKDANDWLKSLKGVGEGQTRESAPTGSPVQVQDVKGEKSAMSPDQVNERVKEMLDAAGPLVVMVANWAGALDGAEKDEGESFAFELISELDGTTRARYRKRLAEALGYPAREFNAVLQEKRKEAEERKGKPGEILETLGGFIGGYLVEYLFDPAKDEAKLVWRDPGGRIGMGEHLDIEGIRFVPKALNKFVREGAVLFPSDLGQVKTTRELVATVEAFIHQNYLLETRYMGRIMAYYVMLTWLYDCFNALPYLRAIGEAGAGKSELMRRVGSVCYRLMTASGANSVSSFFRGVEEYRGTVFIDEADLADGGDMSNDLIKFLNLGAMKGNPIWRLEEVMNEYGGKGYEPTLFTTFCPKLIAMRRDFKDDAVGSRCLTIKVAPRESIELKAHGIHLHIDEEFRQKGLAIRNLLIRWRLTMWQKEINIDEDDIDLEISSRLNQVTTPILAIAKGDDDLKGEIRKFLRAYNAEMTLSRSMSLAARIVEAMWEIYTTPELRGKCLFSVGGDEKGVEYMIMGDIAKVANKIIDEMNAVGEEEVEEKGAGGESKGEGDKKWKRKRDELTARGVGFIVRNECQLQVGKRKTKGFPVFWDLIKMTGLAKRYGVELVEDAEGNLKPPKVQADEQSGQTHGSAPTDQRVSQVFQQERLAWEGGE